MLSLFHLILPLIECPVSLGSADKRQFLDGDSLRIRVWAVHSGLKFIAGA